MDSINSEIAKRRTFAIISHPDAGKTTITEKLLLHGNVIQSAGAVKGKGNTKAVTSDWMAIERERGISVTTSAMQFPYRDAIINLLDTPGHADFSEDTYRTLTAVDSALMVIDAAKGVEQRTIKLIEVTRLRTTAVMTFINKLDREIQNPLELLDEIEAVLKIKAAPMTWPIGSGKRFRGVYCLTTKQVILYQPGQGSQLHQNQVVPSLDDPLIKELIEPDLIASLLAELELVEGASNPFDLEQFLKGELTPVYFGTALGNFGINHILDFVAQYAPSPLPRATSVKEVTPDQEFSGFIFKIQANMDPKHLDRVAFMRIVSGQYTNGCKVYHSRTTKQLVIKDALTFIAGDRTNVEVAYAGDVIGLHNHGTIQIGDTFSVKRDLGNYLGIPSFAPELFKRITLKDPLKQKQLLKGLLQLSEEGSVQLFRPLSSNSLICGAVGSLQFDLVVTRLKHEYNVEAIYESINVGAVRWITSDDPKALEEFKNKLQDSIALDGRDRLVYVAPSMINLELTQERHPKISFFNSVEII